jgi:UPF0755 protein
VEERPTRVRRDYRRRRTGGRIAALVGVLLGVGLLGAIAFAFAGGVGDREGSPDTTTEQAAVRKPVLKIVFPEGFTRKQMAERITAVNGIAEEERNITPSLEAEAYVRTASNVRGLPPAFRRVKAPHLEGFLFPATYEFTQDTNSKQLADLQLEAFRQAWELVDFKYARSKKLTAYDVVVIASMVEKEVQVPRERPLVAAVIYNRLKADMPLGIDATIRYGFDIPPTEPILQSQINSDNPYNTRRIPGLPPTPIANPGLASLQAAAHPADVNYLYFIRKADCKSHFFTASRQKFENYPRAGLQC